MIKNLLYSNAHINLKMMTLLLLFVTMASAQTDPSYFVTKWETTAANEGITIPTTGDGYNYDIDWDGDGVFDDMGVTGDATHEYALVGEHTVQIRGDFPRIYFSGSNDGGKILDITQWGAIQWSSMESAFEGCAKLVISASDVPDFSGVSSLKRMFAYTFTFNSDISDWDVSNITDMSFMFYFANAFNNGEQPLDWANTGMVTNMEYMFVLAMSFNADINSWDTSEVTNMAWMFSGATSFNRDLNNWDTSNVLNMSLMFQTASVFNGNISNWDTGKVTDMNSMFSSPSPTVFNRDIGGWDTKNVTNMAQMFYGATAFDQNIGDWDISLVDNMNAMFGYNSVLSTANYDAILRGWNTLDTDVGETQVPDNITFSAGNSTYCLSADARAALVTKGWSISDLGEATNCVSPDEYFITKWETTAVNESISIPTTGDGYNYDIDWDGDGIFDVMGVTGNATHEYASVGNHTVQIRGDFPRIYFNYSGDKDKIIDIVQWGAVVWNSMEKAFYGCINLGQTATDVPNLSNVANMSLMFAGATSFNGDISAWDTSNVTNMSYLFNGAIVFNGDIGNWVTSTVTDMSKMFDSASAFNRNINTWDTSNVTNMSRMFRFAIAFNGDLNMWNTSNVVNMSSMFNEAKVFNGDIKDWDTSNVTNMSYMFNKAIAFDGNLSTWNTGNVTNMSSMFKSASSFNGNISNWNTTNVTDMSGMFNHAFVFNSDLSTWNTVNVTSMSGMFLNAYAFNTDISGWNIKNVTNLVSMFWRANSFDGDLGSWDISQVTNMKDMFAGITLSTNTYDSILEGWSTLGPDETQIPTGIIFSGGFSKYCAGEAGRSALIDNYNWIITDRNKDTDQNCETLSVNDLDTAILSIFPNPVSSRLFIKSAQQHHLQSAQVYDLTGRLVLSKIMNTQAKQHIDVSNLPQGIYLVRLQTETSSITKRFVKK